MLEYSTFDKVVKVTKGTEHISTFAYGPDRSRYKRVDINKDGNTKTTWYLGNVEIIDHTGGAKSGVREYKRNLGMVIETLEYKAGKFAKQSLNYLLHDHLGSIDVITDELGEIQQELSFDAWGQRRNASSWQALAGDALTQFDSNITTRGYTGHEMVDGVGIIHMNGRIYDPKLARFLQADPIVQEPYMTQSMNRYTYVMNNPLNKTDPSGFLWWVPILKFVASMVIGAVVSDVVSTLGIKHGWSSGVVRGLTLIINLIAMEVTGLNGALSSATTGQIAVIAVIGGIASYLQGGKFGHGFISAGISARMGASDGIKRSMEAAGSIKKLITQVTIGGTVSRIGGGKFANGAGSAAFSMMLSSAYGAMADGGSRYAEKNSGSVEGFDAQKGHFSRNAENDAYLKEAGLYGRNDLTLDEVDTAGEFGFKQAADSENAFHRNGPGNENNLKFTSRVANRESWYQRNFSNRYGRYELIVRPNSNGTFTHVTESINMGTLNRGNNPFTHITRDVIPYFRFGNTPE